MLSLRDKLRAAGAAKPKAVKPPPKDCMIKEEFVPLSDFALPPLLSGACLEMMHGQPYEDVRREELCFLDTETTGLSHGAGTVAFLVGVGYVDGGELVVEQYMLRE